MNISLTDFHPFIYLLAPPFFASGRLLLVEWGRVKTAINQWTLPGIYEQCEYY